MPAEAPAADAYAGSETEGEDGDDPQPGLAPSAPMFWVRSSEQRVMLIRGADARCESR